MKKTALSLLVLTLLLAVSSCNGGTDDPEVPEIPNAPVAAPKTLSAKKLAEEYPHDTSSFTEGLQYVNGTIYEGTGDWENSALLIWDLKTGKILAKKIIGTPEGPNGIFGEGVTLLNDKIYQLTWMNNKVFVYDKNDITKPVKEFTWPYQGWGMTTDGKELIISDGQAAGYIYFVNPETFKVTKTIQVRTDKGVLEKINELEYVNGYIYANRWLTDYILKIDPATGAVLGITDIKAVIPDFYKTYTIKDSENVLNGIAADTAGKRLLITGKNWPKVFAISIPE